MTQLGRNSPCPCGSGKKFKKCCLKPQASPNSSTQHSTFSISSELTERLRNHMEQSQLRKKKFGEIRPIIHADLKGRKFVAVGPRLFHSSTEKSWRTFPDFLQAYMKSVLGGEWGNAELLKPPNERHPIIQWYVEMCHFQHTIEPGNDGIYDSMPNGAMQAYLLLAYDLYLLAHHKMMHDSFIKRLKNFDQFQGARYELFVAATFVKAGFHIAYSDESDRSHKHPEFIATCHETGEQIAVEAKSRHRAGVLNHPGNLKPVEDLRLEITHLINNAIKKAPIHPFIIFVDMNLPPFEDVDFLFKWQNEIKKTIETLSKTEPQPTPYNLVVLTNHPSHYVRGNELAPPKSDFFILPLLPVRHSIKDATLNSVMEVVKKFYVLPNDFDE